MLSKIKNVKKRKRFLHLCNTV